MPLRNMTPQEFLQAAQTVVDRMPDAQLAKNKVGNLAILDAASEFQHGHIDLRWGEVTFYEDEDTVAEG